MLPVAILAGGLAKRLRPITEKTPKAMVDVGGRPFIAWQLDLLKKQGFKTVVICTGYLGEQIEEFVGNGARFDMDVSYSFDGPRLLGTGGAIKRAIARLGDAFFVLYGDSLLPVQFAPIEGYFLDHRRIALMTVLRNNDRWDKSNVLFRNGRLLEYNKRSPRPEMAFIDYGLSILTPEAFAECSDTEAFDLADLFHGLSRRGQLAGYEVSQRFYEIGSPRGLDETKSYLERNFA